MSFVGVFVWFGVVVVWVFGGVGEGSWLEDFHLSALVQTQTNPITDLKDIFNLNNTSALRQNSICKTNLIKQNSKHKLHYTFTGSLHNTMWRKKLKRKKTDVGVDAESYMPQAYTPEINTN